MSVPGTGRALRRPSEAYFVTFAFVVGFVVCMYGEERMEGKRDKERRTGSLGEIRYCVRTEIVVTKKLVVLSSQIFILTGHHSLKMTSCSLAIGNLNFGGRYFHSTPVIH